MTRRPLIVMWGAFVLGELIALTADGTLRAALTLLSAGLWFLCLKEKRGRLLWLMPLFLLLGAAAVLRFDDVYARAGNAFPAGKEVRFTGEVRRTEERDDRLRVWLAAPDGLEVCADLPAGAYVLPGDTVTAAGRAERAEMPRNEGAFDYAAYDRARGNICRIECGAPEISPGPAWKPARLLALLRRAMSDLLGRIADPEEAGVCRGILLGEKWEIDPDQRDLYRENGIAHILAISGLHISLIGLAVREALKKRIGLRPACAAAAAAVIAYGVMTGESTGTLRAVIMFAVSSGAALTGRSYDGKSALGLSGLLILLSRPYLLFQASFQLSFSAAAAILFLLPRLRRLFPAKSRAAAAVLPSLCASVGTLPVLLFHMYRFPLQGLLLNLIVLPLLPFLIGASAAGLLSGTFLPEAGRFCIGTVHQILKVYETGASALGGFVPAFTPGRPGPVRIAAFAVLLLILLRRTALPVRRTEREEKRRTVLFRVTVLALWTVLLFAVFALPEGRRDLTVCMLDVGQGDGLWCRLPDGTTLLVDGGSSSQRKLTEEVYDPFLAFHGRERADILLVSHLDQDHISAAEELLKEKRVGRVIASGAALRDPAFSQTVRESGAAVTAASRGDVFRAGEVLLTVLWPEEGCESTDNDGSLTVLLSWKKVSVLLTGDLEEEQEQQLLSGLSPVTVLKAGHHGSKGSSSEEFLSRLRPRAALISCGRGNSYGHPHGETLERLNRAGCRVYCTAWSGQITLKSFGEDVRVTTFLPERESPD